MGDWDQAINYDKTANGKIKTNAKGEKQSAEMEEMRTEYHKYCPKSKSNNIIYCPKEIIKKKIKKDIYKGMKLKKLNKRFERISDKKRKRKKKKKKKTQKKEKKTKKGSKQKRRENKKRGGKKGGGKKKGDKKRKGKKRKGNKRKGKKTICFLGGVNMV